ncbi:D-alanyl-D-alanine carboxypeptidase/D-alanyl-D-alanine-endopeptidase [Streptomyces peucetius]|uniref:D-alanyl-D-alanine carboxypeptidase/D-alanyl-D-alanine-endopeptidase n=1 Tax=Streptomyces peucetius TaxID=1950 RepID=A0ABY6IBK6_STRPE|nr:D-alanyl-D-alanine carboxypeptidase/D-alanyl-D-alanine-endopeptidase [Streptomyces peucetius]UYQ63585.1 D-alanyl-D-alanine carboxypeptidase/D-alanyl-D-alanine-endopeptidase [Streptomyces peucetius]
MSDRERGWCEVPMVRTWQLAAGAAVVGLTLAAGAVAAAGPWDSGQRKAERDRVVAHSPAGGAHHEPSAPKRPAPAPSAVPVLTALGGPRTVTAKEPAAPGGLPEILGPLLADPGLGPAPAACVIDLTTGERLYGERAETPMVPASTVKIATAAAALTALGPHHRIPTTVVAVPGAGRITLVGGGDATLDRARLGELAERTARALRENRPAADDGEPAAEDVQSATKIRLQYDASLYQGPAQHPVGPNGNIAPVSALMVGQGRLDERTTGAATRSADPAGEAARVFGQLLAERGVRTGTPVPGRAAADAVPLAQVLSRPLSSVVERMLTTSDNDIAEALARQTALATGEKASFAGAERAVTRQLKRLQLPLTGTRFADGSGLNRRDRVSAALLTSLLARAADAAHPELRPILTGLPVAGFSGTLEHRWSDTSAGTGLVRAKTGTLTGINALAGTVVAPGGRLLGFAFLASGTPSPYDAQPALDRLAGALVS